MRDIERVNPNSGSVALDARTANRPKHISTTAGDCCNQQCYARVDYLIAHRTPCRTLSL